MHVATSLFSVNSLGRLSLACVLLCFIAQGSAKATVFNWDATYATSSTWTAPAAGSSVTKTYNSDTAHVGNDVSITLNNQVGTWSGTRPSVDKNYNGGTTQNALSLGFSSETSSTQGLIVTINFSAYSGGVKGVTFSIFDVDYTSGTWIDQIDQIWGIDRSGNIVGAVSVVGSADNIVTGSGTGFTATGQTANSLNTSAGNVLITFAANTSVTQVSFRWKNVDTAKGDQKIGLGDITYTDASPEFGSSLGAIVICGIAVGLYKFRTGTT